jgi:hypothetical protein
MSRFLVAVIIGSAIAAAASTSASAWHCLASSPNGAAGTAFASYWKEPSQSQCAGVLTAAVGLVAKSYTAARTR